MTKTERLLAELDKVDREAQLMRKNYLTYRKAHSNAAAKVEALRTLLEEAISDAPDWKERASAVLEATA